MFLLTLKGSNIALAFTLTIQGDLRPSSFEVRASVFGIMQVLLSDGLSRKLKWQYMTCNLKNGKLGIVKASS